MYERNSDPQFWDSPHGDCNCGSFAFDLTAWYTPNEPDDLYEYAEQLQDEGYNDSAIATEFCEIIGAEIEREFQGEIRRISNPSQSHFGNEVIAFRCGINMELDSDDFFDYHFKVYRNSMWQEKCGWGSVHPCNLDPDTTWPLSCRDDEDFFYNSEIIYYERIQK